MKNKINNDWKANSMTALLLMQLMRQPVVLRMACEFSESQAAVKKCCILLSFDTLCYGLAKKWG
jgi:hypothetical protein